MNKNLDRFVFLVFAIIVAIGGVFTVIFDLAQWQNPGCIFWAFMTTLFASVYVAITADHLEG